MLFSVFPLLPLLLLPLLLLIIIISSSSSSLSSSASSLNHHLLFIVEIIQAISRLCLRESPIQQNRPHLLCITTGYLLDKHISWTMQKMLLLKQKNNPVNTKWWRLSFHFNLFNCHESLWARATPGCGSPWMRPSWKTSRAKAWTKFRASPSRSAPYGIRSRSVIFQPSIKTMVSTRREHKFSIGSGQVTSTECRLKALAACMAFFASSWKSTSSTAARRHSRIRSWVTVKDVKGDFRGGKWMDMAWHGKSQRISKNRHLELIGLTQIPISAKDAAQSKDGFIFRLGDLKKPWRMPILHLDGYHNHRTLMDTMWYNVEFDRVTVKSGAPLWSFIILAAINSMVTRSVFIKLPTPWCWTFTQTWLISDIHRTRPSQKHININHDNVYSISIKKKDIWKYVIPEACSSSSKIF